MTTSPINKKIIRAGIIGNMMEWYDFAIYGYFALIIGKLFFPSSIASTSVIAAFGAFAAGFLMRPIGSLIFGNIGDKLGRKRALLISVLMMAIPTFLIGLLPVHEQIGISAPILLVILRMLQGLSVGGEYTTSVVFLVENSPNGRRGFMASWSGWGAVAGILLGSAIASLVTTLLTPVQLASWGWRLPFLIGIIIAFVGFYIRRHLPDMSPVSNQEKPTSPIRETFTREWRSLLKIAGLNLVNAVAFYMIFVYATTWLQQTEHIAASKTLDINSITMATMLIFIPLAGLLSDKIGRKTVLLIAALGIAILSYPLFWLMHHQSIIMIWSGQFGFAILVSLFSGANTAAMAEMVPARVRVTTVSIGYNLILGMFGGTTPMVCAYLMSRTHMDLSPALYLMAAAVISTLVIVRMKETAHKPLVT